MARQVSRLIVLLALLDRSWMERTEIVGNGNPIDHRHWQLADRPPCARSCASLHVRELCVCVTGLRGRRTRTGHACGVCGAGQRTAPTAAATAAPAVAPPPPHPPTRPPHPPTRPPTRPLARPPRPEQRRIPAVVTTVHRTTAAAAPCATAPAGCKRTTPPSIKVTGADRTTLAGKKSHMILKRCSGALNIGGHKIM
eukprot:5096746-Prymnesium_polylepis.1